MKPLSISSILKLNRICETRQERESDVQRLLEEADRLKQQTMPRRRKVQEDHEYRKRPKMSYSPPPPSLNSISPADSPLVSNDLPTAISDSFLEDLVDDSVPYPEYSDELMQAMSETLSMFMPVFDPANFGKYFLCLYVDSLPLKEEELISI
jgi:hypothetical protein